ncbi:MAG TPA: hypothetical protein VM939_00920 [Gemmatimonadaceae bacterium]|nr:hypothetical protein [Gemmatimonadaceae bacterium]
MISVVVSLLLQATGVAAAQPVVDQNAASSASPAPASPIAVQLGVRVSTDTVTVGQRFIAVIRVRVPRGATIRFPFEIDSGQADTGATSLATQVIGRPAVANLPDATGVTRSAAYRLAAWDTGPQSLSLPDIVVRSGTDSGFVSLASYRVFVRSVLPADTALHVPKPPRARFVITPFNWIPLILLLAAVALAAILWWIWRWYRRRAALPLDPFVAAKREFDRIEAMRLAETGEPERHAAHMADVMRRYLAARVPSIEISHTSSEIMGAAGRIHTVAPGLGELLWQTDLIKFAQRGIAPGDALQLGTSARGIVDAVESHFLARETADKTARRAA